MRAADAASSRSGDASEDARWRTPAWPWDLEPPPPRMVVELEPVLALGLEGEAQRTLIFGAIASALFVALAFLFRRVLKNRDHLAARAEHDRRLAALGEMSGVLAHEIRNPLAALKGHAQLLLETLAEGTDGHDSAVRVVRESVRLESLTSDLLDFIRTGRLQVKSVDPRAMVREAVEAVGTGRFVVRDADAPDRVDLDPERIHQVLVNILRNAAQAAESQTDVTVAGRDGRLEVEVRDHGEGIPAGDEEKIFTPFLTTRTRGTGLGLAVARQIVEAHGGTIEAKNHPDGGALFRVVLPAGAAGTR